MYIDFFGIHELDHVEISDGLDFYTPFLALFQVVMHQCQLLCVLITYVWESVFACFLPLYTKKNVICVKHENYPNFTELFICINDLKGYVDND